MQGRNTFSRWKTVIGFAAFAGLSLILAACPTVSSISQRVDDFSGKKITSVDIYCSISDADRNADISSATQRIVKETSADGSALCAVYVVFKSSPSSFGFDSACVLKTDSAVFNLKMDSLGSAETSETSTTSVPIYGRDKNGHSVYLGSSMSTTTVSMRDSKFKIMLPVEVQDAIKNSSSIAFRFYQAQMPITIVYDKDQMKAIKTVLL